MIGTYSTNFGSAAEIAAMLRSHGLEVKFSKYFFGCATGVAGRKIAPTGRGPSRDSPVRGVRKLLPRRIKLRTTMHVVPGNIVDAGVTEIVRPLGSGAATTGWSTVSGGRP